MTFFFIAQGFLQGISSYPARANQQPQGSGAETQATKIQTKTIEVPFKSYDGYEMFGKLTLPDSAGRHPLVIYVQTAEGMTVDMKRPNGRGGTFNYFDLYREKLPEMNVAFFSYEGRGIKMGDKPGRYEQIDWDIYNTSSLENKVRDCVSAVEIVRKQPGVDASRIFLMGASEGTLLAAETASRLPKQIKGLILYGVLGGNLKEAYRYIVTGGAFLAYKGFFDTDKDGKISKAEFEADPQKFREKRLNNAPFDVLDRTNDGYFTAEDMKILAKIYLDAADTDNYEVLNGWLKIAAAVSTPKDWFKDHFAHPPIQTFLTPLDMPIGCFQGDADASTSIEGVKKLEEWAKQNKKSKMQFHYFEGLDHSLNIGLYFVAGKMPAGHQAIFEFIKTQTAKK
jgi:dienelactone hydrolase